MKTINKYYKKVLYRGAVLLLLSRIIKFIDILRAKIFNLYKIVSCRRKIRRLYINLKINASRYDKAIIKEHMVKWSPLMRNINTKWAKVYMHCSGIINPDYIPEDVYYVIVEPNLNYYPMSKAERDKNLYQKSKFADFFPKTLFRNINGVIYDEKYRKVPDNESYIRKVLSNINEFIVKPARESGGGKSVSLYVKKDYTYYNSEGEIFPFDDIKKELRENYILQERIVQHEILNIFNKSSLNIIRINTYRSVTNNEVILLSAYLRFGMPDIIFSNTKLGGGAIAIDSNGYLANYGINPNNGEKFTKVKNIDLSETFKIPKYDKLCNLAKEIACEQHYSRLLGLDMVLDKEENFKILEINTYDLGINIHQMINGPYFREYTDEVIEYCRNRKVNYNE